MDLEISFPLEFIVLGTPVSHQAKRSEAKTQWKAKVQDSARLRLGEAQFSSPGRVTVCLFYFPDEPISGDIDNIAKLVLDACIGPIILDDNQVERLVIQKFEPGRIFEFSNPSPVLAEALDSHKPALYVRVHDDPWEELL